jgi:dihydroneopterin aldolase
MLFLSVQMRNCSLSIVGLRGFIADMQTAKIELKDLVFFARHGLLEEEARLGQRFRVDMLVELDPALDLSADTPDATVNYVELYDTVKSVFTGRRFNMIEAAADAIAAEVLACFGKVISVTVKVKKPSVPVDCICEYFAAEVTRCR